MQHDLREELAVANLATGLRLTSSLRLSSSRLAPAGVSGAPVAIFIVTIHSVFDRYGPLFMNLDAPVKKQIGASNVSLSCANAPGASIADVLLLQ